MCVGRRPFPSPVHALTRSHLHICTNAATHPSHSWLLIGLATLALVAGLGTLLATPPPSARGEAEDEEQLAWGRRRSPLAFLFGRGGGAEGDEQVRWWWDEAWFLFGFLCMALVCL